MFRHVRKLDLTLIWPMRLEGRNDLSKRLRDCLPASGHWALVRDLLRRGLPESEDGFAYAEFAYFHPFVRRFLYGDSPGSGEAPYDLFRFGLGPNQRLEVRTRDWPVSFAVNDIRLYAMDEETAILAVELSTTDVSWDVLLNSVSWIRTLSYQHFAPGANGGWVGGGALDEVAWDPPLSREHRREGEVLKQALENYDLPILPHWQEILDSLLRCGTKVQPLSDHRAFVQVFAQVDEIGGVQPEEWYALSQADEAGFATYAEPFHREELEKARYLRWWDLAEDSKKKHAYLAGPMTFCNVIGFESFRIRGTWRRQWFQLYLLAVFQRSKLLTMQDRVARLTAELHHRTIKDADADAEVEAIQREFAFFSSRAWFTEVSPQIQGQELYELVKRQMSLDRLHRDVMEDKSLLTNWHLAHSERRLNLWWGMANHWFIPLGLAWSFLGMNVVVEPLKCWLPDGPEWQWLLLLMISLLFVGVARIYWICKGRGRT